MLSSLLRRLLRPRLPRLRGSRGDAWLRDYLRRDCARGWEDGPRWRLPKEGEAIGRLATLVKGGK